MSKQDKVYIEKNTLEIHYFSFYDKRWLILFVKVSL